MISFSLRIKGICLASIVLLVAGGSRAEEQVQSSDSLRAQLDEIATKLATIRDMKADFVEEKHSALLRKPIVSHGTVRVKGDRTRWATVDPRPSTMTTTPDEVCLYLPEHGTVEVYPVDDRIRPFVMSPLPRMDAIYENYHVSRITDSTDTDENLQIGLEPKSAQIREFVKEVRVSIDRSNGLATRVEMTSPDGDRTVITFLNFELNTGMSDADLALTPPADAKIVHPLSKHSTKSAGRNE